MGNIEDIIKKAIDLHFHVEPDILPRKYNAFSLAKSQVGKIGKICIKSHTFPTVDWAKIVNDTRGKNFWIGCITLNNVVGGMTDVVIYAATKIFKSPLVVWFPTVHAENFLKRSKEEFRKEWTNDPTFVPRKSKEVKPVRIIENGKLRKEVINVLRAIREFNCILATGHISWKESKKVVEEAIKIGVRKIIITHPIYQLIDMPINVQKELAKKETFIEHCYSMYSIDKIPFDKIVKQIKAIGPENCILSSDTGQPFSPDSNEALKEFAFRLIKKGISEDEIEMMIIENPTRLISE
jgi:hypothetical protein